MPKSDDTESTVDRDLLQRTFPDEVRAAIARYPDGRQASAVLSLLYLAQAAYGQVSDAAVREVAAILDMDATHVHGLVGFYTLFYDRPHGAFVIHYCNDLPCALRGADDLLTRLCARLGLQPGETSADGLFTLETVKCLAACDRAPLMQVNLEYFYDLTDERLDEIIADLRAIAAAEPPRRPPYGYGPPSAARAALAVR
jgi:NADH-quinone oxidoreductase subunit E